MTTLFGIPKNMNVIEADVANHSGKLLVTEQARREVSFPRLVVIGRPLSVRVLVSPGSFQESGAVSQVQSRQPCVLHT